MPNPKSTSNGSRGKRPSPKRRIGTTMLRSNFATHIDLSDVVFESTVTERFQTTVPAATRDAMGLGRGDRLSWVPNGNGTFVVGKAASPEHEDPAIQRFLGLLEDGIAKGAVAFATEELRDRLGALVEGVEIDVNAPLREEDEDEDE